MHLSDGGLSLQEQQKAWAVNLNGFDIEEAKILRLSGKPQNAPEGTIQGLRELTRRDLGWRTAMLRPCV